MSEHKELNIRNKLVTACLFW